MTTTKKKAAPAAAKSQVLTKQDQEVVDKLAAETTTNGNGSTPKPVPGDKNYDWDAEYPDERVMRYVTPKDQKTVTGESFGGLVIGLAAISEKRQPSVGFLRAVRRKPEFDQVLDMIEVVACDAALSLIDKMRPTDLQNLFEEWSEWSNTAAGKS